MEKKHTLPFNGTEEQKAQLMEVIAKHKGQQGATIPVLHEAQDIYGYLPIEVQEMISEGLGVPLAEIYGIVTFYTQFSLNPKGRYQIGVCLGTACYVKGSGDILEKIKSILEIDVGEGSADGIFSLEATRGVGACGLAQVVTINDDVYGRLTVDEIAGILQKYE